jgi:hypothetical protein
VDDLPYDEPWGRMQPIRHALGALPCAPVHPDNLWALRGFPDCLERRSETVEARFIRQRMNIAAARADVAVSVSCFCARGNVPEHPAAEAPWSDLRRIGGRGRSLVESDVGGLCMGLGCCITTWRSMSRRRRGSL